MDTIARDHWLQQADGDFTRLFLAYLTLKAVLVATTGHQGLALLEREQEEFTP